MTESRNTKAKTVRRRLSVQSESGTPGPGRYSIASSTLCLDKKFTMKKKYYNNLNQTLPGPADYNNLSQKSICGGTIGRTKRKWRNVRNIEPSPDSYSPEYDSIKKRKPQFPFTSGRKAIRLEEYPGPAEPSIKESMSVKGQRSLLSKGTSSFLTKANKSTISITEGPGPSTYKISQKCVLPAKPSFSISKAAKDSSVPAQSPGPGSYITLKESRVQNIIFTKEIRSTSKQKVDGNPGPGSNISMKKGKKSRVLKRLKRLFQQKIRKNK